MLRQGVLTNEYGFEVDRRIASVLEDCVRIIQHRGINGKVASAVGLSGEVERSPLELTEMFKEDEKESGDIYRGLLCRALFLHEIF
jgi:hypothetical protein